jgi:hypothetical protein
MAAPRSLDPRIAGYAVALGTPVLSRTTLTVRDYGGDFAALAYGTLPANQPNTYRNHVYLWNSTAIPFGLPPPVSPDRKAISTNAQEGTTVMWDIEISASSYIFGYAVGPDSTSLVCASVVLDAGGQVSNATSVTIGVRFIGTDSVTVRYQALPGSLPGDAGNWVGLWKGYVSPYNPPKILGSTLVPNVTEGTVTIEGVSIAIDTTYTLVYFMGSPDNQAKNTTAAAILTFQSTAAGSPATRTFIGVKP